MADIESLRYMIKAAWEGARAVDQAERDIRDLGDAGEETARRSRLSFESIGKAAAIGGVAIAGAAMAAREAWQLLGEGAELEAAEDRFGRLAESIGSTSDSMMTRLRDATKGMATDAELVASASEIMSLGLQDTEDGVVRLATVAGNLGWDMQQVIMTMANNSTMRLDSLGLSIEDVQTKMRALEEQGIDADKAFDLAVIEAGEEKYRLLGDAADTTAGKMKIFETAIRNAQDEFKLELVGGFAEGLGDTAEEAARSAENIEALTGAAGRFFGTLAGNILGDLGNQLTTREILNQASALGLLTDREADYLFAAEKSGRITAEQAQQLENLRTQVDQLNNLSDSWMRASEATGEYAVNVGRALSDVEAGIISASGSQLEWQNILSVTNTQVEAGAEYLNKMAWEAAMLGVQAEGAGISLAEQLAPALHTIVYEGEEAAAGIERLNAELDKLSGRTVEAHVNLKQQYYAAGGDFTNTQPSPYVEADFPTYTPPAQVPQGAGTTINVTNNYNSADAAAIGQAINEWDRLPE